VIDEIALSVQYDASGQHDEAINVLARATKHGDVEATTRLGKRLLLGDNAPYLPKEGVRFLYDAARLGGAEAAGRLAVLFASGTFVGQSWNDALNSLLVSAERGWKPAQGQICALANDRGLAARAKTANPSNDVWIDLAKSIDFAYWDSAPGPITLSGSPLVRSFPEFVSPSACAWLIERAGPLLDRARVYDAFEGKEKVHSTRTNSAATFGLADADVVTLLVQNKMMAACGLPISQMEAATVLHYDVGEEITNHFDFIDPRTPNYANEIKTKGQRVITFLIYLNQDYEGGRTEFPKLGLSHKGGLGEGTYFVNALPNAEPDLRTVHAGRPPLSGEKWILSQFIRDRHAISG
jgi:prolyl 4-hydroxylase